MYPTVSLAQTRRTRCRWIVTIGADVDTGMRQVPNQGSSFMQKREFARKRAEEVNLPELPELPDLLELALAGTPARTSVCRALSDLNRRLGSAAWNTVARASRSASPRRRRKTAVESLPLFS
jgi:hypothetical protein